MLWGESREDALMTSSGGVLKAGFELGREEVERSQKPVAVCSASSSSRMRRLLSALEWGLGFGDLARPRIRRAVFRTAFRQRV